MGTCREGSPIFKRGERLILMQPCSKAVLWSVDAGAAAAILQPCRDKPEDPIKRSRAWWVPVGAELLREPTPTFLLHEVMTWQYFSPLEFSVRSQRTKGV